MLNRLLPLTALFCVVFPSARAEDKRTIPPDPKVPSKVDKPHKNFSQKIPDSEIQFDMVFVPGGEFLMGSPTSEEGHQKDESPQVRVKVRPFWLAKCECTWNEFDQWYQNESLMNAEGLPPKLVRSDAITQPTPPYVDDSYEHGRDGFPAICMTHHAAMMYCHYLRHKTGLLIAFLQKRNGNTRPGPDRRGSTVARTVRSAITRGTRPIRPMRITRKARRTKSARKKPTPLVYTI